jgi:dienelactone hydrolase
MKYRLLGVALATALTATMLAAAHADMLLGKSSTVGVASHASLRTDTVEYRDGGQVLEGYVAWDESKTGRRPGVLLVHEWNGITGHTREQARQLAELGYVAFAVDVYGKGVRPATPEAAGLEAAKYKRDRSLFRARLAAGYRALTQQKWVDAQRIAAVGYCFGGTGVLELARSGADLRGIVSVHGGLDSPNPADGKNIKAKVLILHGDADPFVPRKDVDALLDELRAANVDWQMVSYGGAVHAFTNPAAGSDPTKGAAYDADADRRAWLATQQFLDEVLR